MACRARRCRHVEAHGVSTERLRWEVAGACLQVGGKVSLVFTLFACLINIKIGEPDDDHCFYVPMMPTSQPKTSSGPISPTPTPTSGPGGCKFQGGSLPTPEPRKRHILDNHGRSSRDRGGFYDGKFSTDDWNTINGLIQNGAQRPPDWAPAPRYPGTCIKKSQFPSPIGWTYSPNRGGPPTRCMRIVITDSATAVVWNAFPVPC